MRYPILSLSALEGLAQRRINNFDVEVGPLTEWVGSGAQLSLAAIESAAGEVVSSTATWDSSDRDRLEGLMAQVVHDAVHSIATEILDDPGFWRFLAARYFWDFISWRHSETFRDGGTYMKYLDGTRNTEAVLVRMYLRAAALGGTNTQPLAGGIEKAGDFWRSHIIRVQTGSASPIATAFAAHQKTDRQNTNQIRETAKRLNRTWANVILHTYDASEAYDIVDELWSID